MELENELSVSPIIIMIHARMTNKYKNHWMEAIKKHICIISKYHPTDDWLIKKVKL